MTDHLRCLLAFIGQMPDPWRSWRRHLDMWGTSLCPAEEERKQEVLDER